MENVIQEKHIYEFDLEQFFPSVSNLYIMRILAEAGFPSGEAKHNGLDILTMISKWHEQTPSLPKKRMLNESNIDFKNSVAIPEKDPAPETTHEKPIKENYQQWENLAKLGGVDLEAERRLIETQDVEKKDSQVSGMGQEGDNPWLKWQEYAALSDENYLKWEETPGYNQLDPEGPEDNPDNIWNEWAEFGGVRYVGMTEEYEDYQDSTPENYKRMRELELEFEGGVPQGAPTSPLLSIIALIRTVLAKDITKMYADDGVKASSEDNWKPFKSNDEFWEETGIKVHPDKSGWVKKDGKWLKPLKFLGLEYHGDTDTLLASTRKGSRIPVPDSIRTYMAESSNPMLPRVLSANNVGLESRDPKVWVGVLTSLHEATGGLSWENLAKSSALGFVMSRLYQGNFDMDKVKQCFELDHTGASWVGKVIGQQETSIVRRTYWWEPPFKRSRPKYESTVQMNVFNSSSFAIGSLLEILSRNS